MIKKKKYGLLREFIEKGFCSLEVEGEYQGMFSQDLWSAYLKGHQDHELLSLIQERKEHTNKLVANYNKYLRNPDEPLHPDETLLERLKNNSTSLDPNQNHALLYLQRIYAGTKVRKTEGNNKATQLKIIIAQLS